MLSDLVHCICNSHAYETCAAIPSTVHLIDAERVVDFKLEVSGPGYNVTLAQNYNAYLKV